MAVEVKFQADVSAAVQSIKQLEKANAEAAKSGNADASALDRGRMAQDALARAKAVRAAAQAAKEETEAQIKLQAAHLATAKAAAKGADASTQSGKERLKNLQTQQEAMDALIAKAKKLKATVQDGDSLVGRAQNARRDTMQSVSKAAQTIRRRIEQRVVVRDETSRGFMSIQRTARYYALRIKRQFRDVGNGISKAFSGLKGLKGFGALAVVGSVVGAAVAGLKATIDKIPDLSNLAKHARSLGMTGKQLQVLKYACDSAGISFDSFEGATSKVTRTIEQASEGAAEAQKKLAMLGLTAADFAGLNSYEKLQRVAAAINDLGDHSKKTAAAMAFFEESGGKMLDMLSGLGDAEERLKQAGGIINDSSLEAAERFNQALTDISNNITAGIINSGLIEWLAAASEGVKGFLSAFGGNSEVKAAIDYALKKGWVSTKEADRLRGGALFYDPKKGGIHKELTDLMDRASVEQEGEKLQKELMNSDDALGRRLRRSKVEEAERKKKEEARQKEIAALDKQLQDLGKLNRGPQTREEFIQQELEKAQRAAPSQFESRKAEIERAAGEKFDREQRAAEQQEAARREMTSLEEEARAARERARMAEYQGDSLRRIGGTIGGTSGVDRYKQEMIRRADTQLKTLQGIYERMDQIKRDNPHVFR